MSKRKREDNDVVGHKVKTNSNDRIRSLRSFTKKEERAKAMLRRKIRNRPRNENCPLTQDKLETPVFRYITKDGKDFVHGYSLDSLIDWLVAQGRPIDPSTREVYNVIELKRMDREAKEQGIHKPSVYERCTSDTFRRYYRAQRERAEQKAIHEQSLNSLLDFFQFVWGIHDTEPGKVLFFQLFPAFIEDIMMLATLDKARALQIIAITETWEGSTEPFRAEMQHLFQDLKRFIVNTVPNVSVYDNVDAFRDDATIGSILHLVLGNIAPTTV